VHNLRSVLQCVAVCCSVLRCVAVCCAHLLYLNLREMFTVRAISVHNALMCRSVLQCVEGVLQCVAVCDSVLHLPFVAQLAGDA